MEIGIGLPSTIPATEGEQIVEWARRAERRGFSSLGTIDRIVYDNYEPLIALAAAAAVTERIRLTTSILIAPYRANAALLAKQAASVDRLSGGRLVLGMAVGGRPDDFEASGVPFEGRGRRFDEMLAEMRKVWAGENRGFAGAIGPRPPKGDGPEVIIGGTADVSFQRVAEYGSGWIAGGSDPEGFAGLAEKAHAAWSAAGRTGSPRLLALGYYSLGPRAIEQAREYLPSYYGFMGVTPEMAETFAFTNADIIRQAIPAFERAGCDELILFPCAADPDQVDFLADVAL